MRMPQPPPPPPSSLSLFRKLKVKPGLRGEQANAHGSLKHAYGRWVAWLRSPCASADSLSVLSGHHSECAGAHARARMCRCARGPGMPRLAMTSASEHGMPVHECDLGCWKLVSARSGHGSAGRLLRLPLAVAIFECSSSVSSNSSSSSSSSSSGSSGGGGGGGGSRGGGSNICSFNPNDSPADIPPDKLRRSHRREAPRDRPIWR